MAIMQRMRLCGEKYPRGERNSFVSMTWDFLVPLVTPHNNDGFLTKTPNKKGGRHV
jgi:hypothetical protein